MNAASISIAFVLAVIPGSLPAAADDCAHRAERSATIGASGVEAVQVEARAGSLNVVGVPGRTDIRATGTACASSAASLEGVTLTANRSGNTVLIEVHMPPAGLLWNSGSLDLTVEVPERVHLVVSDSSGDIEVEAVTAAEISDSSGALRVVDVAGPVRIDDSSGDITVRNVTGEVSVRDSSGDIVLSSTGPVVVERDSSGDIKISQARGDVLVRWDSSGSIIVDGVDGDFTVERDSSGQIRHENVRGRIDVPATRDGLQASFGAWLAALASRLTP